MIFPFLIPSPLKGYGEGESTRLLLAASDELFIIWRKNRPNSNRPMEHPS